MDHKKNLTPIAIIGLISWTAFILVLFRLEPCRTYSSNKFCADSSSIGLILFYFSLTLALTSLFTVIGYLSRIYLYRNEIFANHFNISLRQGVLLALSTSTILAFLSLNVIRWWTTALLFILIILIEFYFLSKEQV